MIAGAYGSDEWRGADKASNWSSPIFDRRHINYAKISQRENIRARHVCSDTDPNLVLAPSDFWQIDFQARLESLLQNEDKFPGDNYTYEETIIEISIERSRQRGLSKRFPKLQINWQMVDEHLESLGDMFRKRRQITLSIEFVYKEVSGNSTIAKGKKKKKSTIKLEEIVYYIKANMEEGETEEDVNINIEIPPYILRNILDNNRKRKADDLTTPGKDSRDVKGDRRAKLEEYCNWGLAQIANQVAIDQFLELNTILQHPKVVADLMVKLKVPPGIALQFVSNIKKFLREGRET
ncbi:hypothetical protein DL98DRAFT_551725 [Cadophora sp. DSE1049]|nr:hypothetical protein DL98DRAFT_551725 [Cadophora sp. DSE1049]